MAQQLNGYAIVPHATYDEYRAYCLSHGVNCDYLFGNQCVDTPKLLWWQYGKTLQTGNGYAYGCWTLKRNQNAVGPFKLVYNKEDIKRGDVLVFDRHGSYYTGHIGFADEDYHGGNSIKVMGQNQGQGTASGKASNVINHSLTYFLGAFRNTEWKSAPEPTPTPTQEKKKKFPWFLYSRKIRNR